MARTWRSRVRLPGLRGCLSVSYLLTNPAHRFLFGCSCSYSASSKYKAGQTTKQTSARLCSCCSGAGIGHLEKPAHSHPGRGVPERLRIFRDPWIHGFPAVGLQDQEAQWVMEPISTRNRAKRNIIRQDQAEITLHEKKMKKKTTTKTRRKLSRVPLTSSSRVANILDRKPTFLYQKGYEVQVLHTQRDTDRGKSESETKSQPSGVEVSQLYFIRAERHKRPELPLHCRNRSTAHLQTLRW